MEMKNFTVEEYLTVTNRASDYLRACLCTALEVNAKDLLVALEDLFTPYKGVPEDELHWFNTHITDPIRQFLREEERSAYSEWRNKADLRSLVERCMGYCNMLREDLAHRMRDGYRTARRMSR